MHPARMFVKALIDEKLTPCGCAISVQPLLAHDMTFAAKIKACVRINQQHRIAGLSVCAGNCNPVRATRLIGRVDNFARGLLWRAIAIKCANATKWYLLNIPANGAFKEIHCHPRLKLGDQLWRHFRVRRQIIVQPVRPSLTQIA